MILKELLKVERADVYNEHMLEDFHESEVKPLDMIEDLIENGHYKSYGFFEDKELLGYAYFIKAKESILLDYLAVTPEYRSKGYGSRFLQIIRHTFKETYSSLIAEVENPRYSLNKDDKFNKMRRISFYLKNDFEVSNIESCVIRDQYTIIKLNLDRELEDKEIYEELGNIYKKIFGEEYFKNNISVSVRRY